MALQIRGSETNVFMIVDGIQQAGSFLVMESWKWKDEAEIKESDFLGEDTKEYDYQHDGFSFNFTIQERDNAAVKNVLLPFVQANATGQPYPVVNMMFVKRYRDGSVATTIFKSCVVVMDDQNDGNRKDYVKTSFQGKCKEMSQF